MAALGSVLVLIGYYVPLIGTVASLFWALPVAVVVIRHGIRWGILTSIVSGLSLFLFIDWITAVSLWLIFAVTGLTLGWSIRSRHSSPLIITVTTVAFVLGIVSAVISAYLVTGFTIEKLIDTYIEGLKKAYEINMHLLGPNPLLDQFKNIETLKPVFLGLIPAIILLAGLTQAYVNFEVSRRVLVRIGYTLEPLPPFSRWIFPDYVAFLAIALYLALAFGTARNIQILLKIGNNGFLFVSTFLLAESFSLIAYYLINLGIPRFFIALLCVYLYVTPSFQLILLLTGLTDILMDFRRLRYGGLDEI